MTAAVTDQGCLSRQGLLDEVCLSLSELSLSLPGHLLLSSGWNLEWWSLIEESKRVGMALTCVDVDSAGLASACGAHHHHTLLTLLLAGPGAGPGGGLAVLEGKQVILHHKLSHNTAQSTIKVGCLV